MSEVLWFVVVVAAGLVLLAAAVLADRAGRRQVTGEGRPAPVRGVESVDRIVPTYLTQDEIDAMPSPAAGRGADLGRRGEGFAFGYAHRDFATGAEGASWRRPRILIIDGDVFSMRELLAPAAAATPDVPLMIVAQSIADEVLTTLAANRRALGAAILAAEADARDRRRLAEVTGATPVSVEDLRSGYLPDVAFGAALTWTSTASRTWVDPE